MEKTWKTPRNFSQSEKDINSRKNGTRITESAGILQDANYAFFTFPFFWLPLMTIMPKKLNQFCQEDSHFLFTSPFIEA